MWQGYLWVSMGRGTFLQASVLRTSGESECLPPPPPRPGDVGNAARQKEETRDVSTAVVVVVAEPVQAVDRQK